MTAYRSLARRCGSFKVLIYQARASNTVSPLLRGVYTNDSTVQAPSSGPIHLSKIHLRLQGLILSPQTISLHTPPDLLSVLVTPHTVLSDSILKAIPMSPAPGSPPAPHIANSLLLATRGRCCRAGSGYSQEAEFKPYVLLHHL